jgi:hypothetical protein
MQDIERRLSSVKGKLKRHMREELHGAWNNYSLLSVMRSYFSWRYDPDKTLFDAGFDTAAPKVRDLDSFDDSSLSPRAVCTMLCSKADITHSFYPARRRGPFRLIFRQLLCFGKQHILAQVQRSPFRFLLPIHYLSRSARWPLANL